MAIAAFFLLLQLLSFGGRTFARESQHHGVHAIDVRSLLPATTCSDTTSTKGTGDSSQLKIVHRHGPCSNLFHSEGQEKTQTSTVSYTEEILHQDQIRVNSLHFLLSNKSKASQELTSSKSTSVPVNSGSSLGSGNYIVQVGFGTPKKLMSLIFDTGSDLTWIQCQPCTKYCHEQQDPIFTPSQSMSYSNITCNTTECSLLKSATGISPGCGSSGNCIYGIQYGDQSFSVGYFSRETLTVTARDVFHNFQFGCGQNNKGLFGKAAGLLGLGRNKLSFPSQTYQKYGGVFSYCLPSTSSSTGYLSLGAKRKLSPSVKFTSLVTDAKDSSFYHLDMIAISVGGEKLAVSASVFSSAGTIIDSGTVITRLPPTAYAALKSSFQKFMSKYPSAEPLSILDTCFNFTGYNEVTVPHVSLHFQGGLALNIDPNGILLAASQSQVCLAFAANGDDKDIGIIGNLQQRKLDVIYDIAKNRVGFGPGTCK